MSREVQLRLWCGARTTSSLERSSQPPAHMTMETHVGILSESLAALQTGCTAGLLLHSCVRHAAPAWRTGSTREQRHGGGVVQHEVAGMAAIQMSYVEAVNAQATGPSMTDV